MNTSLVVRVYTRNRTNGHKELIGTALYDETESALTFTGIATNYFGTLLLTYPIHLVDRCVILEVNGRGDGWVGFLENLQIINGRTVFNLRNQVKKSNEQTH